MRLPSLPYRLNTFVKYQNFHYQFNDSNPRMRFYYFYILRNNCMWIKSNGINDAYWLDSFAYAGGGMALICPQPQEDLK